ACKKSYFPAFPVRSYRLKGQTGAIYSRISSSPPSNDHANGPCNTCAVKSKHPRGHNTRNGSHQNSRRDPCNKMAKKHTHCRRQTILPAFCKTQNRHVSHANMHGHVSKPGKKHDMPKSKFTLSS